MKRHPLDGKLIIASLIALLTFVASDHALAAVKNVIVMVPDGCSQSIQTLARWYKGDALAVDDIVRGTVQTYMADSVITDSAAAATAFASGHKTSDGFVGVQPKLENWLSTFTPPMGWQPYAPIATVLEGARLAGKATGLVATSRVTHATPAAFAAHVADRGMENEIMEHMVYSDVDVVFGGGKRHLLPTPEGKRTDGENLLDVLTERGYQFVETRDDMLALSSGKAWGLFASSHMEADIDRAEFAPDQPSLAEMTAKAIELLAQDEDGFFLMVEGSQIDWAGHAKDPIYMVTDFLAFDEAVAVALDFAEEDEETLLLIFPDHNTGALSIGNGTTDSSYTATSVEDLIEPLKGMQITSTGLERKLDGKTSKNALNKVLKDWWGIEATFDDLKEIQSRIKAGDYVTNAISAVISANYTVLGWTTHGHAGEDVPLWAYGPDGHVPFGLLDNTDLAVVVADAFDFDLDDLTEVLFVDPEEVFKPNKVALNMDDPSNPVLEIKKFELPTSKNVLVRRNKNKTFTCPLDGLVVYAPDSLAGEQTYVPQSAIDYINDWKTMKSTCVVDVP